MIEFHADDYGMFRRQSARIKKCATQGALNGISIVPNAANLAKRMEELGETGKKLRIAVHLNFVDFYCMAEKKEVPHLVRADGTFRFSYGKGLLVSVHPHLRKIYKEEFKREIRAQLQAVQAYMKPEDYRIDSHRYYHMIPVIFDALMEVLKEEDISVTGIRMPRERIDAYLRCAKKLPLPQPINVIKALLLDVLELRNRKKYQKRLRGKMIPYFYGVLYSGHMTYDTVSVLLEDLQQHHPGQEAELVFHPGAVKEAADLYAAPVVNAPEFYKSSLRDKEAEALMRL